MCASLSDSPVRLASIGSYPGRSVLDNRNLTISNRQPRILAETHSGTSLLVTGASGRIAGFLRAAWRDLDAPPIVWLSRRMPADILWAPGKALPALSRCDTIVALWGRITGTPEDLAANVDLVHQSAALAATCGARRVLHFSSSAVYGLGQALRETDPLHPANAYGRSKLAMEATVRALPTSETRHCCLRLANVVGADSLAPALRPQDSPVRLDRFADGTGPRRSYIAPGDLAKVLLALARLPPDQLPDTLNVTSPTPVTMQGLVEAAGRPMVWQEAPANAIQSVSLDGTRLAGLTPFLYLRNTAQQMIDDWHTLETAP